LVRGERLDSGAQITFISLNVVVIEVVEKTGTALAKLRGMNHIQRSSLVKVVLIILL
jgi:hypothetical protein